MSAWVGDIRVPFPHHGGTLDNPLWLVAHSLECDAKPGLAEALSRGYFQNESVSVHSVSGPDLTVAGLDTDTRGYHAGATGNRHGLADEVTGRASWSRSQWLTGNANAALERQAKALGELGKARGFQPADYRWLSVAEVRAKNARGCCYHYDITRAFGESTHYDPGPGYPADVQLDRIRYYAGVADYWGKPAPKPDPITPGTPTTGGAQPSDWLDMATEDDLRRIIREEITALKLPAQVVEAVWRRDETDPNSAISIKSSLNTLLDEYQG